MSGVAHGSSKGPRKIFGRLNINWLGPKRGRGKAIKADSMSVAQDFEKPEKEQESSPPSHSTFDDGINHAPEDYIDNLTGPSDDFVEQQGFSLLGRTMAENEYDQMVGKHPEKAQSQDREQFVEGRGRAYENSMRGGTFPSYAYGGYSINEVSSNLLMEASGVEGMWGYDDEGNIVVNEDVFREFTDFSQEQIEKLRKSI